MSVAVAAVGNLGKKHTLDGFVGDNEDANFPFDDVAVGENKGVHDHNCTGTGEL